MNNQYQDIKLVSGSDWQGLYWDGELVGEGHSLAAFQVLDALNIKYEQFEKTEKWFDETGGRCPKEWNEHWEETGGIE